VRLYLKKPITKIGLLEWLKVKALSSSSITAKKKKAKIKLKPCTVSKKPSILPWNNRKDACRATQALAVLRPLQGQGYERVN
jgi:hypothetical protein